MDPVGEREQLDLVTRRISLRFSLPPEVVAEAVGEAAAGLASAPIRDFIPVLVEKEVRDRLTAVVRFQS